MALETALTKTVAASEYIAARYVHAKPENKAEEKDCTRGKETSTKEPFKAYLRIQKEYTQAGKGSQNTVAPASNTDFRTAYWS